MPQVPLQWLLGVYNYRRRAAGRSRGQGRARVSHLGPACSCNAKHARLLRLPVACECIGHEQPARELRPLANVGPRFPSNGGNGAGSGALDAREVYNQELCLTPLRRYAESTLAF